MPEDSPGHPLAYLPVLRGTRSPCTRLIAPEYRNTGGEGARPGARCGRYPSGGPEYRKTRGGFSSSCAPVLRETRACSNRASPPEHRPRPLWTCRECPGTPEEWSLSRPVFRRTPTENHGKTELPSGTPEYSRRGFRVSDLLDRQIPAGATTRLPREPALRVVERPSGARVGLRSSRTPKSSRGRSRYARNPGISGQGFAPIAPSPPEHRRTACPMASRRSG